MPLLPLPTGTRNTRMGMHHFRHLSPHHHCRRLCHRIHLSPPNWIPQKHHPFSHRGKRDMLLTTKGCHRSSPTWRHYSRILLLILCGSKKGWWTMTHLRSSPRQLLHHPSAFSYGHLGEYHPTTPTRWLVHSHRFKGYLLSHKHMSRSQQIPQVCFQKWHTSS